jgi:ribonuclease VapC
MKTYVLDASAVMGFLTHGTGEEKVNALIHRTAKGDVRLVISVVNWGEVLYSLAKVTGIGQATADLKAMGVFVESVVADESLAEAASMVRHHYRLGYADCFAAALAIRMNATLVTSDPDFAKLGKKLKIMALSGNAR